MYLEYWCKEDRRWHAQVLPVTTENLHSDKPINNRPAEDVTAMLTFRPPFHQCVGIVLLVAALMAAGCASTSPGNNPVPAASPIPAPSVQPVTTPAGTCQFTNCHGLDLSCGMMSEPQVCTMEYKIGDRCRQYAHCDSSSGTCSLVTDPGFATCKACVDQCSIRAGADTIMAFDCEAHC
jgi:hypothetical protein